MEGGTNAVKNSGFLSACNAVLMLKMEARPGCTIQKASARETNKNKKVTSKLEQGLNFTVNGDRLLVFATMISVIKLKAKKGIFVVFL